jgi:O-antigen ligase
MTAVHEGARGGSGFFGNAGDFGVAMCVVWPLAVILLFAKTGKILRLFLLACSVAFLVVIPLSCTRGAAVGAACVTLAGIVTSRKKLPALVMALLLVVGAVYILPGASKARFQSALHPEGDSTAMTRLQLWRAGLIMFRDNPLFGVGIGNFQATRLGKYAEPGEPTKAYAPHSIYIQVLSELGLAGMIPFLALVVLFFRLNAKSRKILIALGDERRRSYEYCLSVGLDLALIGYLSSGAFLTVFYYPHLWVLLGLSAGLYTACCRIQRETANPETTHAPQTGEFQLVAP